jgi:ubiquinone/menaquinone biosynthesis C-methylase UbiE
MKANLYNTAWVRKFIHHNPFDYHDIRRVDAILESMPEDAKAILDVGIGGGYIYSRIKEDREKKIFGLDISMELVEELGDRRVCVANTRELPFNNESFDLILAADLIEHIDPEDFGKSISEIARITKKYILINSPYKDRIEWPISLCNVCKKEFNIYGHLRTVDMHLINKIFPKPQFNILTFRYLGPPREARPLFLVYLARRYGKVYSNKGVVCPYCFNSLIVHPTRNLMEVICGRVIGAIFFIMDRLMPRFLMDRSEIVVLISKQPADILGKDEVR